MTIKLLNLCLNKNYFQASHPLNFGMSGLKQMRYINIIVIFKFGLYMTDGKREINRTPRWNVCSPRHPMFTNYLYTIQNSHTGLEGREEIEPQLWVKLLLLAENIISTETNQALSTLLRAKRRGTYPTTLPLKTLSSLAGQISHGQIEKRVSCQHLL